MVLDSTEGYTDGGEEAEGMEGMQMQGMRQQEDPTQALLQQSGLSKEFWAYAAAYAVQIYNRVGHSALHGRTPFERAYGYTADISDFRVWGCKASAG